MTTNHVLPALLLDVIRDQAGPEGVYDTPTTDFLVEAQRCLYERLAAAPGLLRVVSLGRVPWLYVLEFATRGLGSTAAGDVVSVDRHLIGVRFLPDCLRRTDRWEMLHYLAPREPAPWHPNVCPRRGAICLEVYPGQPILAIALCLHDLLRYRLRQYDERDALNTEACQYGRTHIDAPLDDRPLFGLPFEIDLQRRD